MPTIKNAQPFLSVTRPTKPAVAFAMAGFVYTRFFCHSLPCLNFVQERSLLSWLKRNFV